MDSHIIPVRQKFDPLALTFRTISAGVPDLPANVAVIEAASHAEAVDKLVKAVRKAPVNLAVWNRKVPEDLQEYARNFMREKESGLLGMVERGQAPYLKGYISGYFNALVEAHDLATMERVLHDGLRHDIVSLIEGVQEKFPKRTIYPSFSRDTATNYNEFHLDGPADEHRETDDPDRSRLYYHQAVRFIINYDGVPTSVAANDDVAFSREKPLPYQLGRHYRAGLKDSFNTVWEMEPWAVGIITNVRWPHPPALHTRGISHEPDRQDSRLRMLLTVK